MEVPREGGPFAVLVLMALRLLTNLHKAPMNRSGEVLAGIPAGKAPVRGAEAGGRVK